MWQIALSAAAPVIMGLIVALVMGNLSDKGILWFFSFCEGFGRKWAANMPDAAENALQVILAGGLCCLDKMLSNNSEKSRQFAAKVTRLLKERGSTHRTAYVEAKLKAITGPVDKMIQAEK